MKYGFVLPLAGIERAIEQLVEYAHIAEEDGKEPSLAISDLFSFPSLMGLLLLLPLTYKLLDGWSRSLLTVLWLLGFMRSMFEKRCFPCRVDERRFLVIEQALKL